MKTTKVNKTVVGVDEAGRGALVGNVVAAAVILPKKYDASLLVDSKSISQKKRYQAADYIKQIALDYNIGIATAKEIDKLNIHHATLLAMKRAINGLSYSFADNDEVWVDGKFAPDVSLVTKTFVKGDSLHSCISAASILAKVYRDSELILLGKKFPEYEFSKHKGYPTKKHIKALEKFGILDGIYRKSYKTIKKLINETNSS